MTDIAFLKTFYFTCYKIHVKALEDINLPYYKGFALRGAFGHALKKTVCIRKQTDCPDCLIRNQCPYSLIMGNPVQADHPHFKKYYTPQRPYIIVPPLEQIHSFPKGSLFSFDLVLIGNMRTYIPHFMYAFTQMGETGLGWKRGKFVLMRVETLPLSGESLCIYNQATGALRLPDTSIPFSDLSPDSELPGKITLRFLTPFRMKIKGNLTSDFSFSLFYKRLLERLMVLNHFFCDGDLVEIDEEDSSCAPDISIHKETLRWIDLERYSNKQQGKMKMGGVTGNITFQGPLASYIPVLRAGEYVHAGKGASFGFGKYSIDCKVSRGN
ncbi:MAG: CRISPR system precrRNA processing endoribonuclease RAMP protein Cas6 [Spirochaetales bacterium]|nr:CRISPR system precrRNA processing endoribonuclease RAMP protein Cas6 [Spirochaetales bacterium]